MSQCNTKAAVGSGLLWPIVERSRRLWEMNGTSSLENLESRVKDLESEGKSIAEILIRIDERTKILIEDFKVFQKSYVRKEEFEPIKKIVWSSMGIAGTALIGAVMSLVIKS